MSLDGRPRKLALLAAALALAGILAGGQAAAARSKPRHARLRSDAAQVVVPRGRVIYTVFAGLASTAFESLELLKRAFVIQQSDLFSADGRN